MSCRGRVVGALAFVAALLCLLLGPGLLKIAHAQSTFYAWDAIDARGAPGSLIRTEPMMGAPANADAYRILYRSTGLDGAPIAVSGVAVVPTGDAPPSGRPVVAWAHPTSGVVPRCAPSLALSVFRGMQGLPEMLARGYVVVATDYPGLGTRGPHPYLVGISEGRAVLDSVRALRAVPAASPSRRFAVWGHSQGGQAALFAGILAADYAPELQPIGIAAAAPATDLETLMRDDFASAGGRNLLATTLWSWTRVFDAPIAQVVQPVAMPTVDALADECIESLYDLLRREHTGEPLVSAFLSVPDITAVEPWQSLMRQNIPGTLPPELPVFLAQGEADEWFSPLSRRPTCAGSVWQEATCACC